jgi:hypothetical protein
MISPVVVIRDIVGDVAARVGALVDTIGAALLPFTRPIRPSFLSVALVLAPLSLSIAALILSAHLVLTSLGLSVAALVLPACLVLASLALLPLKRFLVLYAATEATIGTLARLAPARGILPSTTTTVALLDRRPAAGATEIAFLTCKREVSHDQGQNCG